MKIHIVYKDLKKERCGIKDYCFRLAGALEKKRNNVNLLSSFKNTLSINCDILHLQYEPGVYKGGIKKILPILLKKRNKLFVTFHTLYAFGFCYLYKNFLFYIESFLNLFILSILSKGIIVTNEKSELFIKKFLPWVMGKFTKIEVGANVYAHNISESEKDKIRKDLNIGRKEITLSHFGLFYKGKGLETLFESIKTLKGKNIFLKVFLLGTVKTESKIFPWLHNYYINSISMPLSEQIILSSDDLTILLW